MRYLIPLLILCLLALPAPTDAQTTVDGFTFDRGAWWKDGVAYVRTARQAPGYWFCNRWYAGATTYHYAPLSAVRPVLKKEVLPYSPDWKVKALALAAQRDDHNAYLATLRTLGIGTPPDAGPTPGGRLYAGSYGGYRLSGSGSSYALGQYGASGNSLYGYSLASVRDFYGSTDLNAIYQQAARLTQNAQTLAGQGHTDFIDALKQAGSNQARVAEILAQAEAASRALKAAAGPPITVSTNRTFSFRVEPGPDGTPTVVPVPGVPATAPPALAMPRADVPTAATVLAARCASCHAGATAQGGWNVTDFATTAGKAKAVSRVLSNDPAKRMPRGAGGAPGMALTQEELRALLAN